MYTDYCLQILVFGFWIWLYVYGSFTKVMMHKSYKQFIKVLYVKFNIFWKDEKYL